VFDWLEILMKHWFPHLLGHLFIRNIISYCCLRKRQRFLGSLVVFRNCIPGELKHVWSERLLVFLALWLRASCASSCHFDGLEVKSGSHF
jgi:hypothetical protein